MKSLLLLLSLSVLASSLPTLHQGPFIADDDTLMERRDLYKVEITRDPSSHLTTAIVTRITKYASDVQGYLAESFKGAVVDGDSQVVTITHNKNIPSATAHLIRHGHGRHHRHRISLLGFRNRLATFILAFAVVLTLACSYLRKIYIASLRRDSDQQFDAESAKSEKPSPATTDSDITAPS